MARPAVLIDSDGAFAETRDARLGALRDGFTDAVHAVHAAGGRVSDVRVADVLRRSPEVSAG